MDRAPYPARIAAGLIVTAIEETRKLPSLLITLPMTAISQTLQAGMRAQQNIAELAIKGDAALEMLFDKPTEQPAWAVFDEDETPGPDADAHLAGDAPIESSHATATATENESSEKKSTEKKSTEKKSTEGEQPVAAATTTPAETEVDAEASDAELAAPPRADAGRFALYSSAPEEVVEKAEKKVTTAAPKPASSNGSAPEIVVMIDYDSLTLAQLRARLRSVGVDDLTALVDYEKANRGRAPFITMLENRIASQNKRSSEA
ncbi:lipid droplet-associated protein [Gordonia paraffinivorans]|uniref:lipid droplet-associated protein n=1 Tax=Gordonia paraffinivorans TaxID=175628 RepID=UPI002431768D|nr:lipid droplet-associated protein [Gordonia paraffinivorans]